MAEESPRELADLLGSTDAESCEHAWDEFLRAYNRYILGTARFVGRKYDESMDCYGHVLEELRRDDFKRLREYSAQPTSRFSTWLVVVVRRLCYDHRRSRYGRVRSEAGGEARHALETRRRLQDLIAEELKPTQLEDSSRSDPERVLRREQLAGALATVLEGLSTEERLLLKLRFEDGLAARKIAEVMRLSSEFTVYRRLKVLLADLRRRLAEMGVHEPRP